MGREAQKSPASITSFLAINKLNMMTEESADPPALHQAAASGDVEKIKELFLEGVDANQMFRGGATPLHFAADKGQVNLFTHIVFYGFTMRHMVHCLLPMINSSLHSLFHAIVFITAFLSLFQRKLVSF